MTQSTDVLLASILLPGQRESEEKLARLITDHAAPIIRNVIRGKLHLYGDDHSMRQEAEDIYGDVVVHLLSRLQALVASPTENSIGDFRGYVAVTTYNACHLYLRQKYPARWRLKNRVRYALTHFNGLALWQSEEGDWLCGLQAWQSSGRDESSGTHRLRQLADDPDRLKSAMDITKAQLTKLLPAVFKHCGAPVRLDDLVSVVAELQGVRDQAHVSSDNDEKDFQASEREMDVVPAFATEVEQRSYLRRLWEEISELPALQRTVLLLNLRDTHDGVIALLPLAGIATVRQIAKTVGIPDEEFATLWNDLPLEDSTIAGLLNVTRQQVINLRKAARARLRRRMKQTQIK